MSRTRNATDRARTAGRVEHISRGPPGRDLRAPVSAAGNVGFLSQSGALGLAVIDYASDLGLGVSSFVSVGNKADISGNDLIQYWEIRRRDRVILLYLESFGNPRKFARVARRVAREKADRGGQERALRGGRAGHVVPHRRADLGL